MWPADTVDLSWFCDGRAVGVGTVAFGSINPNLVQSPFVSKDCPLSVQFQFFLLSKAQSLALFPQVQSMLRNCPERKNAIFSTWSDRVLTVSGFACLTSVQVSLNLTYFWHSFDKTWTTTRQTLYVTFFRTYLGRGLDKAWTEIGFTVQSPSNQPSSSSTLFLDKFAGGKGNA